MKLQQPGNGRGLSGAGQAAQEGDANAYIGRIAERIKSIRVRRGMTRKFLSLHSEISERYLSQIESGQANISVALLWRVAHAMDVEVQQLLPDCEKCRLVPAPLFGLLKKLDSPRIADACTALEAELNPAARSVHGIALIGLRGAGKSELGRSLSRRTGIPFVNLVEVVEKLSGMEVGELFSIGGQKAYRRHEAQALDNVLDAYPRVIMEVGGSLVTQTDTFQKLLDRYYTVWVKAEPNEHMERVMAQGDFRPMQGNLDAMDDLKRILIAREREHKAAHYVLNTSGRTVSSCLEELAAQAERWFGADDTRLF